MHWEQKRSLETSLLSSFSLMHSDRFKLLSRQQIHSHRHVMCIRGTPSGATFPSPIFQTSDPDEPCGLDKLLLGFHYEKSQPPAETVFQDWRWFPEIRRRPGTLLVFSSSCFIINGKGNRLETKKNIDRSKQQKMLTQLSTLRIRCVHFQAEILFLFIFSFI